MGTFVLGTYRAIDTTSQLAPDLAAVVGIVIFFAILGVAISSAIFGLLSMGIFRKAGRPEWAAFVPVYNYSVLLDIVGRPTWWIWLVVGGVVVSPVPLIGWLTAAGLFVLQVFVMNDLAKSFAKDVGYTLGLVLLPVVFLPLVGYGEARYVGQGALMSLNAARTWPPR